MNKKRNNIFFAIIAVILCALIILIFIYDRISTQQFNEQFTKQITRESENEQSSSAKEVKQDSTDESNEITIPTIYCIGDSTTLGVENKNTSYPNFLSQSLQANIVTIGDSKITSSALLVKLGVTPVYVDKLSIPETTTPVPIVFLNDNARANNELLKSKGSIDSVTINGINGKITYQSKGNTLVFTRDQPGEASTVNAPTLIQVNNNIQPNNILVLYTGNYEASVKGSLTNYQEQIIKAFNTDRYIVISLTQDDRNETNQALQTVYGDRYLDFKNYLLTSGLNDANLQATQEDQQAITNGDIPMSLLIDELNGNDIYNQLLSKQIINKLSSLNYIDEKNIK